MCSDSILIGIDHVQTISISAINPCCITQSPDHMSVEFHLEAYTDFKLTPNTNLHHSARTQAKVMSQSSHV